ncbi:hypothetical protein E4T56_gene9451, partial [Termitomyces sp. T112]
MRSRVLRLIRLDPANARDTVPVDTPARSASSLILRTLLMPAQGFLPKGAIFSIDRRRIARLFWQARPSAPAERQGDADKTGAPEDEVISMDLNAQYRARLTSAGQAAALIPNGAKVALSLGAGVPPLLLGALADRARAGKAQDISFYYMLCSAIAGRTIFNPEITDRLIPKSYFHGAVERAIDKARREDEFL